MEYKLLSADSAKAFNTLINQHLQDGWELYGQPFAHGIHNTPGVLYQAVVKYPVNTLKDIEPVPGLLPGLDLEALKSEEDLSVDEIVEATINKREKADK